VVSEKPGSDHGALGIVCLEDVIEELIGEEIIDESDVYIDVHKAIRRLAPAPKARPPRKDTATSLTVADAAVDADGSPRAGRAASVASDAAVVLSTSPRATTFLLRRPSGGLDATVAPVPLKANFDEVRESLRHLGPSNPATNPRNTRSTAVKIKPGTALAAAALETASLAPSPNSALALARSRSASSDTAAAAASHTALDDGDEDETSEHAPLLKPHMTGKGGVHALRKSYGSSGRSATQTRLSGHSSQHDDASEGGHHDGTRDVSNDGDAASSSTARPLTRSKGTASSGSRSAAHSPQRTATTGVTTPPAGGVGGGIIGRNTGLTEDLIDAGGVQKIVIRTTASSGSSDTSNEPSPTRTRNRSWGVLGFGGRSTDGGQQQRPSSRDDEAIDPLVVVPDTSSPVEVPLARAITESIDGDGNDDGRVEPVARPAEVGNPFDQVEGGGEGGHKKGGESGEVSDAGPSQPTWSEVAAQEPTPQPPQSAEPAQAHEQAQPTWSEITAQEPAPKPRPDEPAQAQEQTQPAQPTWSEVAAQEPAPKSRSEEPVQAQEPAQPTWSEVAAQAPEPAQPQESEQSREPEQPQPPKKSQRPSRSEAPAQSQKEAPQPPQDQEQPTWSQVASLSQDQQQPTQSQTLDLSQSQGDLTHSENPTQSQSQEQPTQPTQLSREPSSVSQTPTKQPQQRPPISSPRSDSSASDKNGGTLSSRADPRSPLASLVAGDEDMASSTASLGASSAGGGSAAGASGGGGASKKKNNKKKRKGKGKGTAF
jgi:hypothetical protein